MKQTLPRIVFYFFIALALLALGAVLVINNSLAGLVDTFVPGSALWVHAALLITEGAAFCGFWLGVFGRQHHLILLESHSPEQREEAARELARRLRTNPLIKEAGIAPGEPEFIETCLAVLEKRANQEIQRTAQRVFLATALSQNGRLDALIMLVTLCRLIWRVSGIYNQRPHPKEMISLYSAVASSTFLAFSLEELDIATEISVGFGESFQAMAPAAMTGGIPFAGSALTVFTASTIDGAANCYLALRAGIITRNAYAYMARDQESPGRAAVFKEAGGLLMGMSQGLVERLAVAMKNNLMGLTKLAGKKSMAMGKGIACGAVRVGDGIVDGVEKVGEGMTRVGEGIAGGAGKVGGGITDSAAFFAENAGKAVQAASTGMRQAGTGLKKAGEFAGTGLIQAGTGVSKVAAGTGRLLGTPFRRTKKDQDKK